MGRFYPNRFEIVSVMIIILSRPFVEFLSFCNPVLMVERKLLRLRDLMKLKTSFSVSPMPYSSGLESGLGGVVCAFLLVQAFVLDVGGGAKRLLLGNAGKFLLLRTGASFEVLGLLSGIGFLARFDLAIL